MEMNSCVTVAKSSSRSQAPSAKTSLVEVLKKVCDKSVMRKRRFIKLKPRNTWLPEYASWEELDGDVYSHTGLPPKKLIWNKLTGAVAICHWSCTPCRYGESCQKHRQGKCLFKHSDCSDEIEIAAGSPLRLRQIKNDFEKSGKILRNVHFCWGYRDVY